MKMKSLLAVILSLPCVVASDDKYVGPFTSFAGTKKCYEVDASVDAAKGNINFGVDVYCDSLQTPSAWQKPNAVKEDGDTQFDVAIVGAGIGGTYLVSRLQEEFLTKNTGDGKDLPTIALYERANAVGGRLMSGYGPGGLNLGSNPMMHDIYNDPLPMPEYGGMRVDPSKYPLVYNRIVYAARTIFGPGTCPDTPDCDMQDASTNCCKKMLTRMDVGDIRYATNYTKASKFIQGSKIDVPSAYIDQKTGKRSAFKLSDIGEGKGTPYDRCLQLIIAVDAYYNITGHYTEPEATVHTPPSGYFVQTLDQMCLEKNCKTSGIEGLCDLCEEFGETAGADAISCTGYDYDNEHAPLGEIVGLGEEVTDITLSNNLYLLNVGYQRFAQGLVQGPTWTKGAKGEIVKLFRNKGSIVSPQYGKRLKSLSVVHSDGSEPQTIEEMVKANLEGKPTAKADSVVLHFADGSSVTASNVYLTMLPYDLAALDGFGAYAPKFDKYMSDIQGAIKLTFGWANASEGLAGQLGLKSCTEGLCQRLILDGEPGPWLVRQVWLWDPNTVLLYGVGSFNTSAPSNSIEEMARKEGMDKMVDTCMNQIRAATKRKDIKNPDYARLKSWGFGNLISFDGNIAQKELNDFVNNKLETPLGPGVPVFYGNSETNSDNNLHGWAEGALRMVEDSMPAMMKRLGVDNYVPFDPKDLSDLDADPPAKKKKGSKKKAAAPPKTTAPKKVTDPPASEPTPTPSPSPVDKNTLIGVAIGFVIGYAFVSMSSGSAADKKQN